MADATKEVPEEIALDCEQAKVLADNSRNAADPLLDIPPSLLSAEHIDAYVKKTGLISPYFTGGGKNSRLKKASYEGRIGDNAYRFDDKAEIVSVPFEDGSLVVPANSIVFVECDLEFRLPRYIALRFNLQIRHVHRGLLLGTGPLVDPGYWGKLCIPLHNLTDEDYSIPLTDGLIWVEFTKTTSDSEQGRTALEKEGKKEHWDVLPMMRKASQPFDENKPRVGIRSSIAGAVAEANENARTAQRTASETEAFVKKTGFIAALGVTVAVTGLLFGAFAFLSTFIQGTYEQVDETRKDVKKAFSAHATKMDNLMQRVEKSSTRNKNLETKIQALKAENTNLRSSYEEMFERLSQLESLRIKTPSSEKKTAK